MPRLAALPLIALLAAACGGDHAAAPAATRTASATAAPQRTATAAAAAPSRDWSRFGYDARKSGDAPLGIPASRVAGLREKRIALPGTVDASPIYLHGVTVGGARRDVLVLTTTYGRTLALDAAGGRTLWRYQPPSYGRLAGTAQFTTATPLSDRRYVYAATPDGHIRKLRLSDGREITGGRWPAAVTQDPSHEKIASSLNRSGGTLLVTTGGYIGDAPPYQGKVVAISASSGRITAVWNSLCSNRRAIIRPSSCGASDSAIWGRAGAVVDPVNHHVYAASSNGPWNGHTNWGDSVLELSQGAKRLIGSYTPANQAELEARDIDLGSTSPAILPDPAGGRPKYLLQGGKDGLLRLLALPLRSAGPRLGGERQIVTAPGHTDVFTAIAVRHRRGLTEAFVTTNAGTGAFRLRNGRLHRMWSNGTAGTSPVLAGGVLWVYDPNGALVAYRPGSGRVIHRFTAPAGHWNSPIVAGGRVYLPTGDANSHSTEGSLSVFER
jgi:outer membrane protein assembly factor BamB